MLNVLEEKNLDDSFTFLRYMIYTITASQNGCNISLLNKNRSISEVKYFTKFYNFFVKFKNFLHSGSDATLTVRSEAGKASLTLLLYVGHVFHPSADHLSDI